MGSVKTWNNFKIEDFDCPCGECMSMISYPLIDKLQLIRDEYEFPMVVSSGFRCQKHNDSLPNKRSTSVHVLGMAADIVIDSSLHRALFLPLAFKYFNRIGIYERHIHVDIAPKDVKTQVRCWMGSY